MVLAVAPGVPRLGDSFTTFTHRFGLPWRTTAAGGHILRHYGTELGLLTVLFTYGTSVGLRLPYPSLTPSRAALTTLATAFTPADGSGCRLLLADGGWLLATAGCSLAWVDALAAA